MILFTPPVPAPAGQEAILVTIVDEKRPTLDDAGVGVVRVPVVAWLIQPEIVRGRDRGLGAIPVLPCPQPEGTEVLIAMSEGRVYSLRLEESFESLDAAVAMLLREAQAQWDRDATKAAA